MCLFYFVAIISTILGGCLGNQPPVFTQDMNNLAVSEATLPGTVIYTLEGFDPEGSPVTFELTGTDVLQVNSKTGDVTVVKALDHEQNDTLNVVVSIEDQVEGGRNNIVTENITIIVLDENDNPPEFQQTPYEIFVEENAEINTTIFNSIFVKDKDSSGSNIEVDCINLPQYQDACQMFSVETLESSQGSFNGSIILRGRLNFTKQSFYELLLKASDGDLTSTTSLTVNIKDVQDTPPHFTGNLTAEIMENAPIGSLIMTVHAEDGDQGIPRKIAYELLNNPMDYFLLDSSSGQLKTARPLDKESLPDKNGTLTLKIKAIELENGVKINGPLTTSVTSVQIVIKDVNDEPPSFNKREYFVDIPENISEGSALPDLDMTISDPDEGNNSVFSLELTDISGVFSIEPKTAMGSTPVTIRVANSTLDYEDPNQRKFIILVVAKELYTQEKLASTATITVTVNDVNDNAPSFDQEIYSATISEIASPKSLVTTITAKDRDGGRFGENGIIYKLSGKGSEKFEVNNRTGAISVGNCEDIIGESSCLDFETMPEYNLQFIATDDDGKGQTTKVPLKISLSDSNDNPPVFQQKIYRITINEGANRFEPDLIVSASDLDKTSRIMYSIIGGNDEDLFGIDPNTGKIRISNNRALNISHETDNNLALTVLATDGKFTATAIVNITIRDINNNAPIFSESNYLISIKEDTSVGTSILQTSAKDLDTGVNSEVEYALLKGYYDDFAIDNTSGIVFVASKLDFDRRNTYNIEIVALDHGEPSLTGTSTLTVNIINTNNKLPYFKPITQKAEIMENAEIGTLVHTLTALDPDVNSSEALNFAATEPITALDKHGNEVFINNVFKDFFLVDKNTGKVTVNNALQRDVAALVRITVLVTDITAASMQQGQGLLEIVIGDVNDSPPIFVPPWTPEHPEYFLQLKEEQPIGTIVGTFQAKDLDSNIASYAILPQSEYFKINNGTGIVQINKQIDYETIKELNFTILAFDSGVPQLNSSALVRVKVINLNDNDPVFKQNSYNVSVYENSPNKTVILVVQAEDKDLEDFGLVSYNLTGEHSENFQINSTSGEISIKNSAFFDHEMINETVLSIVAFDAAPGALRRTTTVPVYVKILDVNDNSPKFSQNTYNITVVENVRLNPPVPLVQVQAKDLDSGLNGNVHYSIISGNDNEIFLLGVETGILYPHKSLIFPQKTHHLTIEARDGAGNGQLYDLATINIQVLNVNEFAPKFLLPTEENSTIEINELNAIENHLIITVQAIDKDDGENGKVSYHFRVMDKEVQETEEFKIDSKTGELRAKVNLDREIQPKYLLELVAKDHGFPKWLESRRFLTISLVDSNDNKPEFSSKKNEFSLAENNEVGVKIGQVHASDRDEGTHAKIYYYIIQGNEKNEFYLDKIEGVLYANCSFDREKTSQYNLKVLANNDPDFYATVEELQGLAEDDSSITKIRINITDLNDNPPAFEQEIYYSANSGSSSLNDLVMKVKAFDPDQGLNGSLTYYIRSSNLFKYNSNESLGSIIPSPFNITQEGEIRLAGSLQENTQHRFVVEILARENAFPEREAVCLIHVWVFDPEQLIRVILSRPPQEVQREKKQIIWELRNATKSRVIISELQNHFNDKNMKLDDWSDLFILVVNETSQTILPVPQVLKIIDSKYDFLKDYYAGFAIENVLPAYSLEKEEVFDPALAALIALLIVLFVGIISFIIVCCCLRHWVISPTDLKKKDALIKKTIIDDLNTTENPLWIEQKLKIYEEQELTMQVFNEPEQNAIKRRNSDDFVPVDDNTYATIQHPNRRGSSHIATMSLSDDLAHYATLSGVPLQSDSAQSSLRGAPNYYEAAMGFQGSTFQVPRLDFDHTLPRNPAGAHFEGSELTINHDNSAEYVAELI